MSDPWLDDTLPVLPWWKQARVLCMACGLGALGVGFGLGWTTLSYSQPAEVELPMRNFSRRLPPMPTEELAPQVLKMELPGIAPSKDAAAVESIHAPF